MQTVTRKELEAATMALPDPALLSPSQRGAPYYEVAVMVEPVNTMTRRAQLMPTVAVGSEE